LEGPALTVGFTILADTGSGPAHLKGDLRVGDVLVLTKPLGTGILLAGHMRARCRAEWMAPLVHTMLDSNQPAAALFDEVGASGVTDVTGFGFAGHLLEMLRAGDKGAVVQLDAIPLLPGVAELIADGIESTLAPANRGAETEMDVANGLRVTPQYAALFDPQTSGGLLFGIRESEVEAVRSRLRDCGDVPSAVVGTVVETRADCARIQIR
jgi:selenide,water dikinase